MRPSLLVYKQAANVWREHGGEQFGPPEKECLMSNVPSNTKQASKHKYNCAGFLNANNASADRLARIVFCCAARLTERSRHAQTHCGTPPHIDQPSLLTQWHHSPLLLLFLTALFLSFTGVSCMGFNTPPALRASHWTSLLHSFPYFLNHVSTLTARG